MTNKKWIVEDQDDSDFEAFDNLGNKERLAIIGNLIVERLLEECDSTQDRYLETES
jgi:predicted nucleic acid-binding OB-fold protein